MFGVEILVYGFSDYLCNSPPGLLIHHMHTIYVVITLTLPLLVYQAYLTAVLRKELS